MAAKKDCSFVFLYLMYFKSVFIKPNKLYINIFINNLIKSPQK